MHKPLQLFKTGWNACRNRVDAAIIRAIESFTTKLDIDIQRLEKEFELVVNDAPSGEQKGHHGIEMNRLTSELYTLRTEKHKFVEIAMRIAVEIEQPITADPDMPTFEEWLDSPEIRKEAKMWGKMAEQYEIEEQADEDVLNEDQISPELIPKNLQDILNEIGGSPKDDNDAENKLKENKTEKEQKQEQEQEELNARLDEATCRFFGVPQPHQNTRPNDTDASQEVEDQISNEMAPPNDACPEEDLQYDDWQEIEDAKRSKEG